MIQSRTLSLFLFLGSFVSPAYADEGVLIYLPLGESSEEKAVISEFTALRQGEKEIHAHFSGEVGVKTISKRHVLNLILYPDFTGMTLAHPKDTENLEQLTKSMREAATQFPNSKEFLEPHYKYAEKIIQRLKSGLQLADGKWTEVESNSISDSLTVTDNLGSVRTYENVTKIHVENESISFQHSGGFGKAELSSISEGDRIKFNLANSPSHPSEKIETDSPFIGFWVQAATNHSELEAKERAIHFHRDGKVEVLHRLNDKMPWKKMFQSSWVEVTRQFTDNGKSFSGAEIAGNIKGPSYKELGIVYVATAGKLVAATNTSENRKEALNGTPFSRILESQVGRKIASKDVNAKKPWLEFVVSKK